MKRYQKLLGPIALGLSAWGVVLGYCTKSGKCGKVQDVIGAVSFLLPTVSPRSRLFTYSTETRTPVIVHHYQLVEFCNTIYMFQLQR